DRSDGIRSAAALAQDRHARNLAEHRPQAIARQWLIINNQNAQGGHRAKQEQLTPPAFALAARWQACTWPHRCATLSVTNRRTMRMTAVDLFVRRGGRAREPSARRWRVLPPRLNARDGDDALRLLHHPAPDGSRAAEPRGPRPRLHESSTRG